MRMADHSPKRDSFASSFGVLVALAGSAVGLGNLWRFPYLVGQNGGAAFILIYLGFVFLVGLPVMLAEFIIGQVARNAALPILSMCIGSIVSYAQSTRNSVIAAW